VPAWLEVKQGAYVVTPAGTSADRRARLRSGKANSLAIVPESAVKCPARGDVGRHARAAAWVSCGVHPWLAGRTV